MSHETTLLFLIKKKIRELKKERKKERKKKGVFISVLYIYNTLFRTKVNL